MKKLNKVIKTSITFLLLAVTIITSSLTAGAETPYKTFTVDGYGEIIETQTAYTPVTTISKIGDYSLATPGDLKVTDDGYIYIADTGNARILVSDLEGNIVNVIGEGILGMPTGIFLLQDKTLYVADKLNCSVYVFSPEGELINTYGKPNHPLYGENVTFKPTKIAVNESGIMFIVCEGNTNGVVELSPSDGGTFLGYYGTNMTDVSLVDICKNLFFTDAQKAKMVKNLPATPGNLFVDEKGQVYTITQGEGPDTIRKLNIAGTNMIETDRWDTLTSSITIGNYDNIYVTSEEGYIYEYTKDGELLFVFGGKDAGNFRIGLFDKATAIGVDSNNLVYVLDETKCEIQVFEPTEFTNLLHDALSYYQRGLYSESMEPLSQVIEMNSMFDYANLAMGRALLQQEEYDDALRYFTLAKDQEGYSDAYWEVRNIWLQNNLIPSLGIIVALLIIWTVVKKLDKKRGLFNPVRNATANLRNKTLYKQLVYMFYFMKHPIDGSYGVRREKKDSLICANILLALFTIVRIIDKYLSGFIIKTVKEGQYEVVNDIIYTVAAFIIIVACNYLVCTINDGESKLRQLYCGLAYALTPFTIIKPIIVIISNVITYNEIFIVDFGNLFVYVWVIILVFLAIKEINNYSVKETIRIVCITIFTMLIFALVAFIMYVLLSQVWEFVSAIYGEVVYRIAN